MQPILISAVVAFAVFAVIFLLFSKRTAAEADKRKKSVLGNLAQVQSTQGDWRTADEINLLKGAVPLPTEGILGSIAKLSIVQSTYDLLLKAGYEFKVRQFLVVLMVLIAALTVVSYKMLSSFSLSVTIIFSLPVAIVIAVFIVRWYLRGRIKKRNKNFVDQFPDAIDMIVRGVKSGQALSVALRMISENMEPPVATEFRQVIDEVAYGRALVDSLRRMAMRVQEEDVHFFVVVLAVQQETGGNLSEVLGNLSGILRKRKALRHKIYAITSEGRMTSYILGALPVFEFGLVYFLTPGYMAPLFDRTMGHYILMAAVTLILISHWIVRTMINAVVI